MRIQMIFIAMRLCADRGYSLCIIITNVWLSWLWLELWRAFPIRGRSCNSRLARVRRAMFTRSAVHALTRANNIMPIMHQRMKMGTILAKNDESPWCHYALWFRVDCIYANSLLQFICFVVLARHRAQQRASWAREFNALNSTSWSRIHNSETFWQLNWLTAKIK